MEKKLIYEYDILRVFATLLVVVGHCAYYVILSPYGGIDYTIQMQQNGIADTQVHNLFSLNVTLIATFLMPMFFALSGALFNISLRGNQFTKFQALFINKFKRLVIPYLLVAILYTIPIKYITHYFPQDNVWQNIVFGQLLGYGNTHLWFLMSLFWMFLIAWFIEKYISPKSKWLALFTVFIIYIFSHIFTITFLWFGQALQNLLWFYLGYIFEYYRISVNRKFIKHKAFHLFALFFTYIFFWVLHWLIFHNASPIHTGISFLITFWGIMISYFALLLISFSTKVIQGKIYRVLRKYSLEIYLYADPLNYVILYILSTSSYFSVLGNEFGSLVIILVRILGTIAISTLIGSIVKHMKSIKKVPLISTKVNV